MRGRIVRHLGAISALSTARDAHIAGAAKAAAMAVPADLPAEFSWHDYAIFLLSVAAEIEHSLMVQYLYAAYSIGGPQVPVQHRKDMLEWQRIILGIAKEEMGHLVTVQNVIKLLGGALHLDREDYPWASGFYPYAFTLEPLSRKSLAKYVVAESPETWPDDVSSAERKTIEDLAREDAEQDVARVGALYQRIREILSDPDKIPDAMFHPETYPFQASWDEWGRGYAAGARGSTSKTAPDVLVLRASSRTEAVAALAAVAEQGEAVTFIAADSEDSHFSRFLAVYRAFSKISAGVGVLPLAKDPRAPGIGAGSGGAVVEHPEARLWAALFNLRYRMLLSYLAHAFRLSDDPAQTIGPGRRGQVVNRIFGEMYHLKSIAGLLVQLPLKDDPGVRAGPPFQMPYTLSFPAAEPDFWQLHLDLLTAASAQLATICGKTSGPGGAYAETLRRADREAIVEIETILHTGPATARPLPSVGSVR
jgi:rubrerythrin